MFIDSEIHTLHDLNGTKVLEDCIFLSNYYKIQDAIREYTTGKLKDFQVINIYRTFYDLAEPNYLETCEAKYGKLYDCPTNIKQMMESMTAVSKFIQNDLDVEWPKVKELINIMQKVGKKNRQYP